MNWYSWQKVRFSVSCLILKRLYNLRDETLAAAWIRDPYMQYFTGEAYFQYYFTYPPHITINDLIFKIQSGYNSSVIYSMSQEETLPFYWNDGYIHLTLEQLGQYDGIIINK